ATLVPPYLEVPEIETSDPRWNWLGFTNTRVWRCGNRGNVATVLIEKPSRGDWLPVVDCGFDLQYAPLLEYREGLGRVTFCQLDVTGRSEADPAARQICANLLADLARSTTPATRSGTFYAGDERGADLLRRLGVSFQAYNGQRLDARSLVVVGPGAPKIPGLIEAVASGAAVVALGLNAAEVKGLLPTAEPEEPKPLVSPFLERFGVPELTGISNAELHWRTKPAVATLEKVSGEGTAALRVVKQGQGRMVFCQAAPWSFDYVAKPYLRTTWRRSVYLVARLLANLGATAEAPLLSRFGHTAEVCELVLPAAWKGQADKEEKGEALGWSRAEFDDSAWRPIAVPGTFESQFPELADYDGVFWYRIRFQVPKGLSFDGLKLDLGAIDDESWVWLNGKFLGEVTKQTNPEDYYRFPRVYPLEPGSLNLGGENVLVVRVRDTYLTGGILGVPRLTARGPWLRSFYLQDPQSVDDPYRYYRW
ncbi:MAG: beta galactosidase jelly roll domain-containing protein, partial [Armatimonadota bacterium]|nr:beta galactosidase jelly roll domain-containing protein [Armatimonadota bacterium]